MSCRILSYLVADVNGLQDLVPLGAASEEFSMSKRTLERLLLEHKIAKYRRPGDRKVYVLRAEVVKHLGFHEVRAPYD